MGEPGRRAAGGARVGREGVRTVLAVLLMCAAVSAVYFPVRSTPQDDALLGLDYQQLHVRRIRYARQALFEDGRLPAWYSRELTGSPFWSNVQSFPFIPTRLALLPFDPMAAYAIGVQMAAILSALFTFAFCRRLGLGRTASAAAGWTFACSGYFASRVLAGYLPLLEAYPALPLLLWLVEACVRSAPGEDRRYPLKLAGLSAACACTALAGHPQIPLYAVAVAGLYLVVRGRARLRAVWPPATAMGLGAACGAFALWPMLQLVGRSTRVLALSEPTTDIAFAYGRLKAFLFPWRDGWPDSIGTVGRTFRGYPNDAYFWDTVCYVGWLPLAAVLFLGVRLLFRHRRPEAPWAFFAAAGALALVTARPRSPT